MATLPGDAAHRRAAAVNSGAAPPPPRASPDIDTDKKLRRRPPAVKPRRILETFVALAVTSIGVASFLGRGGPGVVATASRKSNSEGAGAGRGRELGLDTKEAIGVGAAASSGSLNDSPPPPPWVLSLSDPPDDEDLEVHDVRYGDKLLTGRYAFHDSPGCSSASSATANNQQFCVSYHPEIDLSDHLNREEALDVQPSVRTMLLRGGNVNRGIVGKADDPPNNNKNEKKVEGRTNTPVIGHTVTIPKGADDAVAVLTRHGFKGVGAPGGKINQDRALVISPYLLGRTDTSPSSSFSPHDFLIGLFDGHGERGHAVSEWAASELPKALGRRIKEVGVAGNEKGGRLEEHGVRRAITKAYQEIDDWAANVSGSGSTATSMLRLGNEIYVINTGDSRSFVATYVPSKAKVSIAFISAEHKPDVKEERERIESLGGQVLEPPRLPPGSKIKVSARVLAMLPGGFQLGLAMSRSIGDPEAAAVGVVATPTITVLQIDEVRGEAAKEAGVSVDDVKVFAVVASDGIYDHIEPEEVGTTLADSLYSGRAAGPSPLQACEQLIMKSSDRWIKMGMDMVYRDDISIAVAKVLM